MKGAMPMETGTYLQTLTDELEYLKGRQALAEDSGGRRFLGYLIRQVQNDIKIEKRRRKYDDRRCSA